MKSTSIDTINNDLADGATIQAFQGTLTRIYELRTIGAGTEREWTKQNGEMSDADGNKITVEFRRNGAEVPTSWKNKELRFESVKGERGTNGIKVLDDTYNNKTTRKLTISSAAEMSFIEGDEAPAQTRDNAPREERQQQQAPQRERAPAAARQVPIHGATVGMAINKAMEILREAKPAADRHAYFRSSEFSKDLWELASDVVRVSQYMEAGNLAPTAKERAKPDSEKAKPDNDTERHWK